MDTYIYHYHPETKQYLGKTIADISPLDNEILVPAYATRDKPPNFKKNHVAAFIKGSWVGVEDLLGQSVWLPDGTEIQITRLDQPIPDNALRQKPDLRSLDDIRQEARAMVAIKHAEILRSLAGDASSEERDTWQTKALASEALLSQKASASQTNMLETEASMTGEKTRDLAQRIMKKYTTYQKLIGLASGLKRKTEKSVAHAANAHAVKQILTKAGTHADTLLKQWNTDHE